MVKVPPLNLRKVLTLAVVAEPVMTMVTVPKPAVVELAAVLVTVTLPTNEELQELREPDPQYMMLAPAAGAALLFAK